MIVHETGVKNPPDDATLALLALAAAIAKGERDALHGAVVGAAAVPLAPEVVDELLLQSVLTVGWPRALSAASIWRRVSPHVAPGEDPDEDYTRSAAWEARGEVTCRTVYGANYDKLRANVRALHPALDRWMLVEGYGRTLSRPALDLRRRELCTVTQCAVLDVPAQLHSHLKGAVHAGAGEAEVQAALDAARPHQSAGLAHDCQMLWEAVRG